MALKKNDNNVKYKQKVLCDEEEPFISNARFLYKDITSFNYKHRIKLDPENEQYLFLPANEASHHFKQDIIREHPLKWDENAFNDAELQTKVTCKLTKDKRDLYIQKEKFFNKIITDRNSKIQNGIDKEKSYLKHELTRIIKEALIYCRKNNAMSSMLPNSINEIIAKAKEDSKTLNISISSVNLTQTSRKSARSVHKYESNAFLKSLGIDLANLHPDNITINADKAYEYITKWKSERNVNQILRYKVINEIMSIEEKRASQKVEILNKKLKIIKERKREERERKRNLIEKALREEKPSDRVKRKMMKSVFSVHDFNSKKNKPVVEIRQPYSANRKRKRVNRSQDDMYKHKPIIRYNSCENLGNILNFIHKSRNLSENEPICTHFKNLSDNQRIEQATRKLKRKNKIVSII